MNKKIYTADHIAWVLVLEDATASYLDLQGEQQSDIISHDDISLHYKRHLTLRHKSQCQNSQKAT